MRNLILALAALTLALCAYAAPASAQNFEIGAKIGVWAADDLDTVALPGDENDSSFISYGIVAQYNINEMFGVRVDIEMAGSDTCDATTFVISGVYNFMTRENSDWIPYARVGIVISDIDIDLTGAPEYDTEFGLDIAAGVAYYYEQFKFFGELGYRMISFDHSTAAEIDMNGVIFGLGVMFIF